MSKESQVTTSTSELKTLLNLAGEVQEYMEEQEGYSFEREEMLPNINTKKEMRQELFERFEDINEYLGDEPEAPLYDQADYEEY
jgi:hypothetical protein